MKLFNEEMANFALSPFYVTRGHEVYTYRIFDNMDADVDYDCLKSDSVLRVRFPHTSQNRAELR